MEVTTTASALYSLWADWDKVEADLWLLGRADYCRMPKSKCSCHLITHVFRYTAHFHLRTAMYCNRVFLNFVK